jgi:hypothetical protein
MLERIAPGDMMDPLLAIFQKIGEVTVMAGAPALPLPIQGFGVTRDQLYVEVSKKFYAKATRLSASARTDSDDSSGLVGGLGKLVARLRDAISPSSSRTPTPVTSDNEDEDEMSEDQKRLVRFGKRKSAFSREPADYPIVPYSGVGSRAGSFRGVDGSGSIGAVCGSSSPARKPGS